MNNNNLSSYAFPFVETPKCESVNPGFSKHEIAALIIAQGLVAKYNLKTPEDQKLIAQLSYELSTEILNQF